jgi:hypothetical protein
MAESPEEWLKARTQPLVDEELALAEGRVMTEMIRSYAYMGSQPGKVRLIFRSCPCCGESHDLIVDMYKFEQWVDGNLPIQKAFPDLTPAERELFLTAIDGECFRNMPKEEDEEDAIHQNNPGEEPG